MSSLSLSFVRLGVLIGSFAVVGVGCNCGGPAGEGEGEGEGGNPDASIAFASLPTTINCADDSDTTADGEQVSIKVVLENQADCTTVSVTNSREAGQTFTGTFGNDGEAQVVVTFAGAASPGASNPITATCTTKDGKTLTVTDNVTDTCQGGGPTNCDTPELVITTPVENDTLTASPTTVTVTTSVAPAGCTASAAQTALLQDGLVTCVADNGASSQTDTIQLATGTGTTSNLQLPGNGATTITCTLADDPTTPAFPNTASAVVHVNVSIQGQGCTVHFPVDGATYTETDDLDHDINNGINLPMNADCPANNNATFSLLCTNQPAITGSLTPTPNGDGTFHLSANLDGVAGPDCSLTVHMDAVAPDAVANYHVNASVPQLVVTVPPPVGSNGFYDIPDDTDPSTATLIDIPITLTPSAFPTGATFTADVEVIPAGSNTAVDSQPNVPLGNGTAPVNVTIHVPAVDATNFNLSVKARQDGTTPPTQIGPTVGAVLPVDAVAPSVTFFFPNETSNRVNLSNDVDGNAQNGLQVAFALTVSADTATCSFAVDAQNFPGTHSGTTCVATIDLSNQDGSHQLTGTAVDAAGHTTTAGPITFSSDGTVPTVTSIVVDQAGADNTLDIVDNGNVATTGNVTASITVQASADLEGQTVTVAAGGANCSGTVTGGVAHLANCTLSQGGNTLVVSATDAGGNSVVAANATVTVVVDTVAPVIAIAAPSAGTLLAGNDADTNTAGMQQDVTVSSDAGDGQVVTIFADGAPIGQCTLAGGACTVRVTVPEGSSTVTATVSDAAGNASTSAGVAFTTDSTVPTLTLTAPANVAQGSDVDAVTPGVQVNVQVTGNGLGAGRAITIESDVEGVINDGACTSNADGTAVTCRVTFTQDGTQHLTATATEASGNVGTSAAVSVGVVTGLFTVVINNPPVRNGFRSIGVAEDSDPNTAGAQVVVSGTTSAPNTATAQVLINGVPAATTCTIAAGSLTCGAFTLNDGATGTFEVTVLNAGTGETGTSGVRNFRVDLGRPTVAITNPSAASVVFNKASDVVPGGALDVDITVNVAGCENGTVRVLDGTTVIGSATVGASGSATGLAVRATTTHQADAETWSATCTDSEGNTPTTVPSFTAKVDFTAPSTPALTAAVTDVRKGIVHITYTQPGDDNNTGTAATVAMFCSTNAITDANFGGPGQVAITVPQNAGGTAEAVDTPAERLSFDNTWNCALRATDDAGNTSALATATATPATTSLVLAAPSGVNGYAQSLSRTPGDINGDGVDDLVVGAPDFINGFGTSPGAFEVVLGAATTAGITRTLVPAPAAVTCATPPCSPTNVGYQVNVLPSLNGDRFDDVAVVTAPNGAGEQFVLLYAGGAAGIAANQAPQAVLEVPSDGFIIVPPQPVGDVDGNGTIDWAIADQGGRVFLFLNTGAFPTSGALAAKATTVIANSDASQGAFGQAIAGVGKLSDGDTRDDFVVSNALADPPHLYVIHGRAVWPATIDVATLTGGDVVNLAQPSSAEAGFDLSSGDTDGDGVLDVGYLAQGGVFVVHGTGTTFSGETQFNVNTAIGIGAGLVIDSVNGDARADVIGGGPSPTTLFLSGAAAPTTYGVAAQGVNQFEYAAVNVIGSSPEPDVVIADTDPPGSVTIRF